MRTRAGIVLINDNHIALIERFRAGLHYFVFPGGGVDEGETPEQAAIRESMEELGVEVGIKQKVAEIHFGTTSTHVYFLAERVRGEFGTGEGEEFTRPEPENLFGGTYNPVWMPIEELSCHDKVFPVNLANMVAKSVREGWNAEPRIFFEESK